MNDVKPALILVLLASLVLVGGFGLYLIGGDRMFALAAILLGGLVIACIVAASSLPIRAWRKNDNLPVIEKHIYHEGRQIIRERVIDARPASLPQLPAPQQAVGVFPELLRASYRAGVSVSSEAPVDGEVRELDAGEDWQGDIRG